MKSKLKSLIQNNKFILLTGLSAFFIIMVVYFCFSIIPFGDKTIYRMDLYHQYGPLFSEFYDRITSGESLLYSWNSGLGSSFLGNFYNYLSSPFSTISSTSKSAISLVTSFAFFASYGQCKTCPELKLFVLGLYFFTSAMVHGSYPQA